MIHFHEMAVMEIQCESVRMLQSTRLKVFYPIILGLLEQNRSAGRRIDVPDPVSCTTPTHPHSIQIGFDPGVPH
jgi:hypothetical protein